MIADDYEANDCQIAWTCLFERPFKTERSLFEVDVHNHPKCGDGPRIVAQTQNRGITVSKGSSHARQSVSKSTYHLATSSVLATNSDGFQPNGDSFLS